MADPYRVAWRLTNACLCGCENCASGAGGHILMLPRLYKMARAILSVPVDRHEIHFMGGEPLLHPFIPQLISFFLGSRRDCRVIIESSGRPQVGAYSDLLKKFRSGNLGLVINAHPDHSNPADLIALAAAACETGHPCHIRIWQNEPGNLDKFKKAFERLTILLPVSISLSGQSQIPARGYETAVFQAENGMSDWLAASFNIENAIPESSYLLIEPDGVYSAGGLNGALPLWQAGETALLELPGFQDESSAQKERITSLTNIWLEKGWRFPVLPDPISAKPDEIDKLKSGLFGKVRLLDQGSFIKAQPEAVWRNLARIRKLLPEEREERAKLLTEIRLYVNGANGGKNGKERKNRKDDERLEIRSRSKAVARLQKALKWLRKKPKPVETALPANFEDYLDLREWLALALPDWRHDLREEDGAIVSIPSIFVETLSPVPGRLSIVIAASGKGLAQTLASILAQPLENLEIIIALNGLDSDTIDLAASYQAQWPELIRLSILDSASLASKWQAGFDLARGEFITFANSGTLFQPDGLAQALAQIGEAQIALAGAKADNFPQASHPLGSPAGIIYRTKSLSGLEFAEIPGQEVLQLNLEAFYLADKIAWLDSEIILEGDKAPLESAGYAPALAAMRDFRFLFGLNADDPAWQEAEARLYQQYRTCENLARNDLPTLGASRPFTSGLLCDCALAWANENQERIEDFSVTPPQEWQALQAVPYGNADFSGPKPELSVILPCGNQADGLEDCLLSIMAQDADFELILIDDATSDPALLEAWADKNPAIRLYQMLTPCGPGACRNFGLTKVRGDYVIFADSDDVCLPGYFQAALNLIKTENADLAVFSTLFISNGKECLSTLPDAVISRYKAIADYYACKFEPAPWAKIWRMDIIRAHDCQFATGVIYEDSKFLLSFLASTSRIVTSARIVYKKVESGDSPLRPRIATRRHIESAIQLYELLEQSGYLLFGPDFHERKNLSGQIAWNLENCLLPVCAAALRKSGELPFSDADLARLGKNPLFLEALAQKRQLILRNQRPARKVNRPENVVSARFQIWPNTESLPPVAYLMAAQAWLTRFPDSDFILLEPSEKASLEVRPASQNELGEITSSAPFRAGRRIMARAGSSESAGGLLALVFDKARSGAVLEIPQEAASEGPQFADLLAKINAITSTGPNRLKFMQASGATLKKALAEADWQPDLLDDLSPFALECLLCDLSAKAHPAPDLPPVEPGLVQLSSAPVVNPDLSLIVTSANTPFKNKFAWQESLLIKERRGRETAQANQTIFYGAGEANQLPNLATARSRGKWIAFADSAETDPAWLGRAWISTRSKPADAILLAGPQLAGLIEAGESIPDNLDISSLFDSGLYKKAYLEANPLLPGDDCNYVFLLKLLSDGRIIWLDQSGSSAPAQDKRDCLAWAIERLQAGLDAPESPYPELVAAIRRRLLAQSWEACLSFCHWHFQRNLPIPQSEIMALRELMPRLAAGPDFSF